jgi:4-amino-4-deoxy-L-arabinose transferase-like glycosyltransferase
MPAVTRDRLLLLFLGIVFLSTFSTPPQRDLFVGDETKYGQVVREMRATGAWLLPTLEGKPFTHKPPLHFWFIKLLTYPLGIYSTWAFVIPSLVAFAFLIWLMVRMSGTLAAFVCATSLLVWASAQTARMDVAFTAFITLGVWLMQRFFDSEKFGDLEHAAISFGIAALIKGPMAAVIGIVLFALEWWRRGRIPRGKYRGVISLLFIVPMLWFIPAMTVGGRAFTNEVLQKQLAGRAVGAWVHASPPWYYVAHSPGFLFPWFALGVTGIATRWRAQRFNINWILAVLVPYSLMSSKLDVYMMALIPPLSIVIADCVEHAPLATRRANLVMLIAFAAIGFSVFFFSMPQLPVNLTVPAIVLAGSAVIGLFVSLWGAGVPAGEHRRVRRCPTEISTIAVGVVPVLTMMVIVCGMMPRVNEYASTQPLIRALVSQHVPPERIALYSCPYLWSRDMPRELERVQYVTPQSFASANALVVATSSKHANEIDLRGYAKSVSVQMIGKWFDVYRR